MHTPSHTIISLCTGAIVVNVPTPIDAMFTPHMIGELIIFGLKAITGAVISIGINRYVDYLKKKKELSK